MSSTKARCAAGLGALLLMGLLTGVCAADQGYHPPPGANEMLRSPVSIEGATVEAIVSDVVIPPNASVPRHTHPVEEFVYIIEGTAIHREDGQPDRLLSAGDTAVIPPGAAHSPRGGPEGARAIVFRVHPKGQPERLLVD